MAFLPRENLIWRSAPEDIQVGFVLEISRDQFGAALFKITAGRIRVEGRSI